MTLRLDLEASGFSLAFSVRMMMRLGREDMVGGEKVKKKLTFKQEKRHDESERKRA